jgi:hypothetical protein
MMSAERFAVISGSYWSSIFPRLEHFVRVSNSGSRVFDSPIELDSAAKRHPFVTETAFLMWKSVMIDGVELDTRAAQSTARVRLAAVSRQVSLGPDLTSVENSEAEMIAGRLLRYFRVLKNLSQVEIDPKLPGCGPISGGTPDLLAVDSSYGVGVQIMAEIKTVNRKFRSTDIRQLIIYLVLYFAQYEYLPSVVMVVNPLLGRSIEIGVDDLFEFTSGRSGQDVMSELLFEWSTSGTSV